MFLSIERFRDNLGCAHFLKREGDKTWLDEEEGLEKVLTFPSLDMVDDTQDDDPESSRSLDENTILSFTHKDCDDPSLTGGKGSSLGINKSFGNRNVKSFPI